MKHPKLAVSFLLLVQAFHLASLQSTAASPGPTIHESWNREADGAENPSQNTAATVVGERENEKTSEDDSSGTASGLMEDDNAVVRQIGNNPTVSPTTLPPPPNASGQTSQSIKQSTASPVDGNSPTPRQSIPTVDEKQSATNLPPQATTLPPKKTTLLPNPTTLAPKSTTSVEKSASSSSPEINNGTDSQKTTLPTVETPTIPTTVKGLNDSTGPADTPTVETSEKPDINETSPTTPAASTVLETTTMPPVTTEDAAAAAGVGGDSSERGSGASPELRSRQQAWGAVLGTGVVVACVGLVVYIIMKRKNPKGFTHRKLEEEFPSDPVLRLDNSEPLDLNFGRSGYTNPGLQSDHIQMSNIPGSR